MVVCVQRPQVWLLGVVLVGLVGCARKVRLTPLHERGEFAGQVEVRIGDRKDLVGELVFHRRRENLQFRPNNGASVVVAERDGGVSTLQDAVMRVSSAEETRQLRRLQLLLDPFRVPRFEVRTDHYRVFLADEELRVSLTERGPTHGRSPKGR